ALRNRGGGGPFICQHLFQPRARPGAQQRPRRRRAHPGPVSGTRSGSGGTKSRRTVAQPQKVACGRREQRERPRAAATAPLSAIGSVRSLGGSVVQSFSFKNSRHTLLDPCLAGLGLFGSGEIKEVAS